MLGFASLGRASLEGSIRVNLRLAIRILWGLTGFSAYRKFRVSGIRLRVYKVLRRLRKGLRGTQVGFYGGSMRFYAEFGRASWGFINLSGDVGFLMKANLPSIPTAPETKP